MRRPFLAGNALVAAGLLLLAGPAVRIATGVRAQSKGVAATAPARPDRPPGPPAEGTALGRLELPRLGLDLVVFEGVSEATLRKGPGHLSGTAWPRRAGEGGNVVIAGHRDSFFRRLADARRGDLVLLREPSGTSTFRLSERRIVRPEDVSPVAPTADARLTLITCYPFSWTGSAPYRLVWRGQRLDDAPPPVRDERPR